MDCLGNGMRHSPLARSVRAAILCVGFLAATGCASTLARSAAAPKPQASQLARFGPCIGLGERFYDGLPEYGNLLPLMATITRRVNHRERLGVCYTTPQSLAAALDKSSD